MTHLKDNHTQVLSITVLQAIKDMSAGCAAARPHRCTHALLRLMPGQH